MEYWENELFRSVITKLLDLKDKTLITAKWTCFTFEIKETNTVSEFIWKLFLSMPQNNKL